MTERKIAVGQGYRSRKTSRLETVMSRGGMYGGLHTGTAAGLVPEPRGKRRARIRFQSEAVVPALKRRTPLSTRLEADTDDRELEEARRYLESLPEDPPEADVIQVSFKRRRLKRPT